MNDPQASFIARRIKTQADDRIFPVPFYMLLFALGRWDASILLLKPLPQALTVFTALVPQFDTSQLALKKAQVYLVGCYAIDHHRLWGFIHLNVRQLVRYMRIFGLYQRAILCCGVAPFIAVKSIRFMGDPGGICGRDNKS